MGPKPKVLQAMLPPTFLGIRVQGLGVQDLPAAPIAYSLMDYTYYSTGKY